jgi:hypothetical protein
MAQLPSGFDRADGVTELWGGGVLGTANPEGAISVQTIAGTQLTRVPIEEQPDSPEIERAEQATVTHRFTMSWDVGKMWLKILGRGTLLFDANFLVNPQSEWMGVPCNVTRVLSTNLKFAKPGTALLTVVSESISFDPPWDEIQIVPVELGLNIMKHPRYFWAFIGDGYGSQTERCNQMVIRLLQDYFEDATAAHRESICRMFDDSMGNETGEGTDQPPSYNPRRGKFPTGAKVAGTDEAKAAAMEIIQKFWRGEETPYIVGWQVTYSQYWWRPPRLNPGGYTEDPILNNTNPVPDWMWNPNWPEPANFSDTIFSRMAKINPQCYSDNGLYGGQLHISWLRKADQVEHQRTWFKLTSTWIGSPVGFWDPDLYNQNERPQVAGDYNRLAMEEDMG